MLPSHIFFVGTFISLLLRFSHLTFNKVPAFIFISNREELGPTIQNKDYFDFDQADNLTKNLGQLILQGWSFQTKERKLDFIDGPVGFSNMDKAGLLIHGYDELNTMITWYHFPYQKKTFNTTRV